MKKMSKVFAFIVSLIMVLQVAGMASAKPKADKADKKAAISLKIEFKDTLKDEEADKDGSAVLIPMGITWPRGGF